MAEKHTPRVKDEERKTEREGERWKERKKEMKQESMWQYRHLDQIVHAKRV